MKIRFKAHKDSADALILGLAKSGIPVSAECEELRMIKVGDVYITADFPSASPEEMVQAFKMPTADVVEALYGESKTAASTVSEEERTFF